MYEVAAVHQLEPARVPPQNKEAERNVLGAMLLAPGAVATCLEVLKRSDFYFASHGVIFEAIGLLEAENAPADAITVGDKLASMGKLEEIGGPVRIHELAQMVPASANARYHADIVKRESVRRRLISAGQELADLGYDGVATPEEMLDQAERTIVEAQIGEAGSLEQVREPMLDLFRRHAEAAESGVDPGITLGLRGLDALLEGVRPGNFIIVAGRPGMGKSVLAAHFCDHVSVNLGKPSALFSLEMSKDEVLERWLSKRASVSLSHVRTPRKRTEQDWGHLTAVADKLFNAPLYVDDAATTLSDIRSRVRRLKRKEPDLGLVVIDYLGLIQPAGTFQNREREVAELSRSMKHLATEINCPIVCVVQLSRAVELRHNKRPILSDLRDSGSQEQDANVVVFVYRDEYYDEDSAEKGLAELIVSKHRNGPTGTVKVAWSGEYTRFSDLAVER